MPRTVRNRTHEEWTTLIQTQQDSGLSVAKFCRQNSINQQAFYRQRNRLESHHSNDEFIKVEPVAITIEESPTTTNRSPSFFELTVGVVSLILPEHASPQWVAELIREVNQ